MAIFPKLSYKFNTSLSNLSSLLREIDKMILNFIRKWKGNQKIDKIVLKMSEVEVLTHLGFKM